MTPLYGWHSGMGLGGYDRWKTREPDYYDEPSPDDEADAEAERAYELEAQANGELPALDIIDLGERCGDYEQGVTQDG
jgi:hypothetical protein